MNEGITIQVDQASLHKLTKDMGKYSQRVQKGVHKNIVDGARNIETIAKTIVPFRTGRLRASIMNVVIGKAKAKVKTDVEYAADVEFGHSARTVKVAAHTAISKKGTKYSVRSHTKKQQARKARPYMKPAADKEWPLMIRRIEKTIAKG